MADATRDVRSRDMISSSRPKFEVSVSGLGSRSRTNGLGLVVYGLVSRGLSRPSTIFINSKSFLIVISFIISIRLMWNMDVMASIPSSELDIHINKSLLIVHR